MLHLRTLGRLALESADGRSFMPVLSQPRRLALFVYLAAARPRGAHQRDALLPLFWAEADEASARHALSQALYWLRERLADDVFEITNRDAVGIRAGAVACDVVAFDEASAAGRWSEALDLYGGDFLAGFHVTEARAFNDWLEQERSRLRQQAARAAWSLARDQAGRGAIPEARASAWRAARLAPTAESSVREFLTALAAVGCRADAVAFYEEWSHRLEKEYELAPSAETLVVVAELRRMEEDHDGRTISTAPARAPAERVPTGSQLGEASERGRSGIASRPTTGAPSRRPRVLFGTAAALAALLLSGAWWMAQRPSSAPPIRSLAVLPLTNLMGDSAQDYFVDGMHDALTAELSKIGSLKVISRTSALRYRDTDKGIPQIARELEVEGLIEGSVLRDGDRVRITVQLIDGASDQRIWGDSYQRELRDILALQREVARAIAGQIQVRLTDQDEARLAYAPPVDPAAYEDYLRGLHEWSKFTIEGWQAAIGHFQRSLDQAPSFAPAYAMMSFAYSWQGYYRSGILPALLRSGALNAAERAVALSPSLAEAHASLAFVKIAYDWDWLEADQASRQALRLNPNSVLALLSRGFFLSFTGRHDEAISVGKRAVELDPVAPYPNTWLGWIYFMARRYDDAIAQVNRVLALEPGYADAHVVLLWAYAKKGMFDQALAALRRVSELAPEESRRPPGWWAHAWILAMAGRADEARAILKQVTGDVAERPMDALRLAQGYGELGERDHAFALLDVAYQGRPARMSVLKVDPRFDALRDDPRFDYLLRRMNFPD